MNPLMIVDAARSAPNSIDRIMAAINRVAGKSNGSDLLEEPSPPAEGRPQAPLNWLD
jgi:hypothetical protein